MKLLFYYRILLVSTGLLCYAFAASAQVKVQWDKTYGGSSDDELTEVVSTPDGSYLLAGSSNSPASGEKSEENKGDCNEYGYCSYDYWLIKTDEEGNKLWDKTLGGMGEDRLSDITPTADGGYLLLGASLIKIDAQGNKQWEKPVTASWITAGAQGGYLLAEDQDTTYWIAKIDEQGNKEWEKTFADDRSDSIEGLGENPGQRITSITSSADGGYLLAGTTFSIGGRGLFENDYEYHTDYWVVKLDAQGNKLWEMRYGSKHDDYFWRDDELYTIIPDEDGGFLLAGLVLGGIVDYWIIKIDAQGNKLWDNTLGDGYEERPPVTVVPTGTGYLMAGSTPPEPGNEEPSGDRSEASEGGSDYWIVMLDEQGNKLWDRTLGGSRGDVLQSAILTSDRNFLLAGSSNSPASGEKSEDSRGALDYWIVKAGEEADESSFVKNIALIDADTDEQIQEIQEEDTIDLATLSGSKFSIVAITEPAAAGSVTFKLEGPFIHEHTENYAPYALFGDNPKGDHAGRLFPPGAYTLTATPYTEKNKTGKAGTTKTIHFTIIHSDEIEDSQVTAFDLYDAVTDQKIMDLEDGAVIHTDELAHEELTVLIHTVPDFVGSVKVELEGPISLTRIENTKPYALFRNNSKDLFGQVLSAGTYTLKATPYTEANAKGEAGMPLQISFMVVGGDTHARFAVHPIPTSGVVHISYKGTAEDVNLMLVDFTGNILLTSPLKEQSQLDLSAFRKGIYYLKVIDKQGVQAKRVVVE